MDIHEEYIKRRKLLCPLIKYADKNTLILKSRNEKDPHQFAQVSIEWRLGDHNPGQYVLVLYSGLLNGDAYNGVKAIAESRWDWDQYEPGLLDWASAIASKYEAISSEELLPILWINWLRQNDAWLAQNANPNILDLICNTLSAPTDGPQRKAMIEEIEAYLRVRNERTFVSWRNTKQIQTDRNYAGWLGDIVNGMHKKKAA